jgi:malate dehydrogenase (quinone)
MPYSTHLSDPDVILIGSGIMSANLGAMLKRLEPRLKIQLYEVTEELAQESSRGWNNAGTGHAGLCELSYTPNREADGTVAIAKVLEICEQFERSKQFWSYAVETGMAEKPREFINPVPHLSFVHGAEMVGFLRARYEAMSAHPFFRSMVYTTDRATLGEWAPLLVEGRGEMPIAATRMDEGTDVNFGALAGKLLRWLSLQEGCGLATGNRVVALDQVPAGGWKVGVKDLATGELRENRAKFVFVGAGGGSLALLQRSGIPEGRGIGGFPIGGQWLVCENPDVVRRHQAKVYGQPLDAAPTMAVPHLDTRILDGRKTLLFGPYAAWTTKFLHGKGHWTDLPRSVQADNLATLVKIGLHNFPLVRYLIQQGTQSMADRLGVLRIFYPAAREADWKLIDAGIRVQAITKKDGQAGIVHYGTEVITSADHTLSALLGASPGASVSVSIVLEVIRRCLPHLLASAEGHARMKAMIPTYDIDLKVPANTDVFARTQRRAHEILQIG